MVENAMDDELTGDPLNPHAWNQPEVHQFGAVGGPLPGVTPT
jgi:hypothetical protein